MNWVSVKTRATLYRFAGSERRVKASHSKLTGTQRYTSRCVPDLPVLVTCRIAAEQDDLIQIRVVGQTVCRISKVGSQSIERDRSIIATFPSVEILASGV